MSYSVKLTDEILISGFSALQPQYWLTHQRVIAVAEPDYSSATIPDIRASEVAFDLTEQIGKKGLRFHDRSSKLTLAVIKLLLEDTKLGDRYSKQDINLVVGSDGALQSQQEVVREAMLTPKLVNPKAYPNRGCNVIAGQASLMFGLLGESTVISSGYRSGVDALIYAIRKVLVGQAAAPYIVAAGEALSEARSLRKKHKTCSGSNYILPIEGAVALSLERASAVLPDTLPEQSVIYQIIGYQQIQQDTNLNLDDTLEQFLSSLDYDASAVDVAIVGLEDNLQVQTQTDTTVVPYDVFGVTPLLSMVEAIVGNPLQDRRNLPETIAIAESDRHGCSSIVLLKRR